MWNSVATSCGGSGKVSGRYPEKSSFIIKVRMTETQERFMEGARSGTALSGLLSNT
jgi:hypothetical protein